ncbi:MAG: hypothetical protein J6V30_02755 [Paludibacteraceae bacterium]|nr:hypothetical protein [Paludibacteraceae bacterium]
MMFDTFPIIITVIGILFLAWIYCFLPAKMAKKRGRSVFGWIILFLIITPIWGIIALLILGDSKSKIREEIINELNQN